MEPEFKADTEHTVKSNLDLHIDFGNNFLSSLSEHYPLTLKVQVLKVTSNEKLFFLSGAKNDYFSSVYVCFLLKRRYSQVRNVIFNFKFEKRMFKIY